MRVLNWDTVNYRPSENQGNLIWKSEKLSTYAGACASAGIQRTMGHQITLRYLKSRNSNGDETQNPICMCAINSTAIKFNKIFHYKRYKNLIYLSTGTHINRSHCTRSCLASAPPPASYRRHCLLFALPASWFTLVALPLATLFPLPPSYLWGLPAMKWAWGRGSYSACVVDKEVPRLWCVGGCRQLRKVKAHTFLRVFKLDLSANKVYPSWTTRTSSDTGPRSVPNA